MLISAGKQKIITCVVCNDTVIEGKECFKCKDLKRLAEDYKKGEVFSFEGRLLRPIRNKKDSVLIKTDKGNFFTSEIWDNGKIPNSMLHLFPTNILQIKTIKFRLKRK